MPHDPAAQQRSSDPLLWLAGAIVALVAITWLLLAQPWSDMSAPPPTITSVGQPAAPARTAPGLAAVGAPAEPGLDETLRLAQLAQQAGMLLEPAGYGAWDLYIRVLEQEAGHPGALEGLTHVADALAERGRIALQQGRTADARELAELIRGRLPGHAGALGLVETLAARATARPSVAPGAPRAATAAEPAQRTGAAATASDPVPALRERFDRALAENRLLEPAEDSATALLARLSAAAPAHAATRDAREQLFERFLALAQQAIAALDAQAASTWIDEAALLGIHADAVTAARDSLTARRVAAESTRLVAASDLTLLHYVPPDYPPRAIVRSAEGWVDLEFAIDTEGRTNDIVVTAASHDSLFHDAARAAVAQWRFEPRSYLGQRITQRSFTRIRFALE